MITDNSALQKHDMWKKNNKEVSTVTTKLSELTGSAQDTEVLRDYTLPCISFSDKSECSNQYNSTEE